MFKTLSGEAPMFTNGRRGFRLKIVKLSKMKDAILSKANASNFRS